MVTHRRRRGFSQADEIFRLSQRYLYLRAAKLAAEKSFSAAARPVKAWLAETDEDDKYLHGEQDADGNRIFRFSQLIPGDGKYYEGVMLRRTQGLPFFDPDEVLEFARRQPPSSGVATRVIRTIEVPDLEELYVLQQEGVITEAELRSLMHTPDPTYALWPMEAAEMTEEE